MTAEVRFFESKPHNILVMRFMGNLSSKAIFQRLRNFVEQDPPLINAPELWDARTWAGMIFDDELSEQIAWNYRFRLKHGLATDNLQPIVLLTRSFTGTANVASQFADIRNQPVPVAFDADSAWTKLVPNAPMPEDVRRFLARR